MTVPAQHGRRWTGRSRSILAAVLALAMLVPAGVLGATFWREQSEHVSSTQQESDGIEYLMSLGQLAAALVDAQAAAVDGQAAAVDGQAAAVDGQAAAVDGQAATEDALTRAVGGVAEVDERLGDDLRVRERWSQLRNVIEELARTGIADARTAYDRYGEAIDMLLDLYGRVRGTSGLARDTNAASYYLQGGAGRELPETIAMAGRLVDLIVMADAGLAVDPVEISVARVAVVGPSEDLAIDIQAALDATESRTLSNNVLTKLELFLREKDRLLVEVPADGDVADVEAGQLVSMRVGFQAAGVELLSALLLEMDGLVADRADALRGQQLFAGAAMIVMVLLGVALVWIVLSGRARSRQSPPGGGPQNGQSPPSGGPQNGRSEPANGAPPIVTYERRDDERPPVAEQVRASYAGWERSGAR